MDRNSMTSRIIETVIRAIEQEREDGSVETLHSILKMVYDDLTLRELIDVYNAYDWEDL
jgi:hypothetical protein